MADLALKQPGLDSGAPLLGAVAAASGGDAFVNEGETFLYVKNTDAVSKNVTIAGQRTCPFGVAAGSHNSVTAVALNEEKLIGPFNKSRFNDANGKVQVTYSAVTGVTVAAVKVAPA